MTTKTATCHCGAVELRLDIPNGLEKLRRYFCSICGIYTHHRRRSDPREYGVNVANIEGVDPYALGDVPVLDGVNHPRDRLD